MKNAREVEPSDDEPAEVGYQGDGRVGGGLGLRRGRTEKAGCGGVPRTGGVNRRGMLERKVDIHKGGDGLDGARLLGVFNEVALAGLVLGVPVESLFSSSAQMNCNGSIGRNIHVELRIVGAAGRAFDVGGGVQAGEACIAKLVGGIGGGTRWVFHYLLLSRPAIKAGTMMGSLGSTCD